MTSFAPGYQSRLYCGPYDLSAFFNSADVTDTIAKLETTTFGNSAKQYTPGLAEGMIKAAGFFSGNAGEVNRVLHAQLGSTAGEALTFYPNTDALGSVAYLAKSRTTNATSKSAVGGMVQTDGEFVADGGLAYGVSLHALSAETATGNGTGVDGGASTSTGWSATAHVTAITGTTVSCTLKLQDSADNVTFADVTGGGFTAVTDVTGPSSQILRSAAGATLRRYVRVVRTISGTTSCTFAAAVARHT